MFFAIYAYLSLIVNLRFDYDDGLHLIVGTIVTTIILNIIDILVFKLAFDIAGSIKHNFYLDGGETKTVHWFFRALFVLIVYLFSLTPVCKVVVTPVVNKAYDYAEAKYKKCETDIVNTFQDMCDID